MLGHKRRYTEQSFQTLAQSCGLAIEEVLPFNRIGTPAWWLNGKLLRRRYFGLIQMLVLNMLTPMFRVVDPFLPFPPLSLVAVLRQSSPRQATSPGALPQREPTRAA